MDVTKDDTTAMPATVGAQLRAARESQSLSLEDIGRQTRVPVRHLVQIEEGRLQGLPAAPYSAGFVKSYARSVGLDPVALSHAFRAEFDAANRNTPRISYEPYEPADPVRLPPRALALVAALIALLMLVSYGVWRSGVLRGDDAGARAKLAATGDDGNLATTPAAAVSVNVPAPVALPAVTGAAVQIIALQPVWMKISERNGATLFIGVLDQGKTYDLPASAVDPVIRTGRPEAIGVTVAGKAVAPLGAPAQIISDVSLKAAPLLAKPIPPGTPPVVASPAPPPVAGTGNTADNVSVPPAFRGTTGSRPDA